MPTDFAIRLCPKLVVLPPNFKKYQAASEIIQSIFWKYSDNVECVSLDEAYLDVSHAISATEIGKQIKDEILKATGLVASVGIAPNKFLAKIASDWKKPNGFFVISPSLVEEFVKNLPVKCIPGVGKKSNEHFLELGINTCEDIRRTPPELLALTFGKFSQDLYNYSRGIDNRPVQSDWERKSLSVETTFLSDIADADFLSYELQELLHEMRERVIAHLDEEPHKKIKKIFVKVKFSDIKQLSSEESLIPFDLTNGHIEERLPAHDFLRLMKQTLAKKTSAVRLIGVGVRFLTPEDLDPVQLSFLPLCG